LLRRLRECLFQCLRCRPELSLRFMGKPQASPCLGERRISRRCLTQDGNRRFPTAEVKERDPQIAEHRRPARSERLALFEAGAGWLEPAVLEMLDALDEQRTRLRNLLLGRICVNAHVHVTGLPVADSNFISTGALFLSPAATARATSSSRWFRGSSTAASVGGSGYHGLESKAPIRRAGPRPPGQRFMSARVANSTLGRRGATTGDHRAPSAALAVP
jgi:hypothetical protein